MHVVSSRIGTDLSACRSVLDPQQPQKSSTERYNIDGPESCAIERVMLLLWSQAFVHTSVLLHVRCAVLDDTWIWQ
jgi:hypothetical protein